MNVTVAYALPHQQTLEEMDVPENTTVEEAISMSHLLEKYPEIDFSVHKVGVLGKLVTMTTTLRDGDRVEIYRPLPKKVRDAHAGDDRKARIRAKKEQKAKSTGKMDAKQS